jgi:hypothetical protein
MANIEGVTHYKMVDRVSAAKVKAEQLQWN